MDAQEESSRDRRCCDRVVVRGHHCACGRCGRPWCRTRSSLDGARRSTPRRCPRHARFVLPVPHVGLLAQSAGGVVGGVSGVPGGTIVVAPGREVGTIGRERLWLEVGSFRSSLEIDGGGAACGPNRLIARQGIFLTLVPVSGAAPTAYGIVPDGATVTGRAAAVTQSGAAYMVRPSSRQPGRF